MKSNLLPLFKFPTSIALIDDDALFVKSTSEYLLMLSDKFKIKTYTSPKPVLSKLKKDDSLFNYIKPIMPNYRENDNKFTLETTGEEELGKGTIMAFAAPLTEQLSYDLDGGLTGKAGGIFTKQLLEITKKNNISMLDMLTEMTERTKKYKQTPQMSFGSIVNLNKYFEL